MSRFIPGALVRLVRRIKRFRHNKTGRFVNKDFAKANPDITDEVTLTVTEEVQ